jgi:uncharacterized protein (DUF305 family)
VKLRLPLALGTAALSAGLVLGACGSSDHGSMGMGATATSTAAIPADAEFNATDVAFAQGMIPHHAQAIEMADMALAQSQDAQVKELATAIKAAQQPEIDQLTSWLRTWGQPVPEVSDGMDHSMDGMEGMMMSGMMSDADMDRLASSSGADFDRLWLEMMIQHHAGAVSMAQDELSGGKYAPAKQLAEAIVTTQEAEIATMDSMLAAMPA